MIVWSGQTYGPNGPQDQVQWPNDGGIYDPANDSWSPTNRSNAPIGRKLHSAVWTGTRMIIWGGYTNNLVTSGGSYEP
ncbi:MAG: hypothetical protein FJ116_09870 [Deltaproteobacteria bacterium]|nr:hypothetical protein [Deltaproteobacteria bacterium]